jgi:hypothetical protein
LTIFLSLKSYSINSQKKQSKIITSLKQVFQIYDNRNLLRIIELNLRNKNMYPNGSVFHMNLIGLDVAKDASHIQVYLNMKKTMKAVLKWYIF